MAPTQTTLWATNPIERLITSPWAIALAALLLIAWWLV